MRSILLIPFVLISLLLGGCGGSQHVIAKEHKARAAEMCKHDKGVGEVLDADGANFTARCVSGIIVAGIAQL